jgi:hypothetical protein
VPGGSVKRGDAVGQIIAAAPLSYLPRALFNNRAMAKKKPTKPTKVAKPRAAARKPPKTIETAGDRVLETDAATPVEETDANSDAAPVAPREVGVLTGIEIGHVAGDVWGALTRDGALTVAAIKKEVKAPGDVVAAAIGWLAREEKLNFDTAGRVVKISLR